MKDCILIDGNSVLYRMFYGMRPMHNAKGMPTSAVYGFTNLLIKIQNDYDPEYMAVAFDRAEPTFRHEAYKEYKAGREAMSEDLVVQLDALKQLLEAMNIKIISKAGYEADDIIGTLCRRLEKEDITTQIITGDRDSFQLINPYTSVLYTATRTGTQLADINEDYIEEKYGIPPQELKIVKALMGDKSDNIPGIKGVGEKTALKLVQQYHSLENLYAHVDEMKKSKMKERIIDGKQDAYDSLFLGTIDCDVPLDIKTEELQFHGLLNSQSQAILKELDFRSVLNRLDGDEEYFKPTPVQGKRTAIELNENREVQAALLKLNSRQSYTINYYQNNTPQNDPYHAPDEGGDIFLAFEIDGFNYFISDQNRVRQFIVGLCEMPNADKIQTVGHNFKNLEKIYNRFGSTITNLSFDIYLASYLNDPSNGQYDLSAIAMRWLDEDYKTEEDLFGKGRSRKTVEEVGIPAIKDWMIDGLDVIKTVKPLIEEKIMQDGMSGLLNNIEMALEPVLAEMEEAGFKIDLEQLKELAAFFERRQSELEDEIYELSGGYRFNIGSPKQLGEVLFDRLKLPVIKRTKTGYSTNAEVLETLKPYHPIVEKVLEWRMINKLNSTYGNGLIGFVDPQTDKIYSTFQQTVTTTGRISSTDPNLQNIPVKTELGREIRKVFVASTPERVLVDADYSQIELRVLAALSDDESLKEAFKHDEDVHKTTAAKVFNEALDEVSPEQRSYAKIINFGLIYGKQAFTLAKDLGISRKEAQDFIDTYFKTYPKIKNYLEGSVASAKEKGYSQTFSGRRRYIPELQSRNNITVQAGERMAQNMPIQGAAADIIKLAMIRVYHALRKERLDARLILQVHDELIIDSSKEDAERVKDLLVREMENAVDLGVRLKVEAHIGYSWYEAK